MQGYPFLLIFQNPRAHIITPLIRLVDLLLLVDTVFAWSAIDQEEKSTDN